MKEQDWAGAAGQTGPGPPLLPADGQRREGGGPPPQPVR